jgi:nickel-dependent lactate racemase
MREFWLPYGDTELPIAIENEELCKVLLSKNLKENKEAAAQVNILLRNHIEKLFSEKKIEKIALITPKESIQTNFINELTLLIKEELLKKGLKKENLNIIQLPNFEEIFFKIKKEENQNFSFIEETNLGIKFFLNRIVAEADAKILIGETYPNFLFNFLNPFIQAIFGLTKEETIIEILKLIELNKFSYEKLIEEIKNFFLIDLDLTLIPNAKGETTEFILGSLNEVLNKEKEFIENLRVKVENKAGLIIGSAGGSFLDLNFLRALSGLKNLSHISEEEGIIIYLAECKNGLGFNPKFKKLRKEENEENIEAAFNRLIQKVMFEILEKTKIYLISSLPNYYAREILGVKPYETLNSALKSAKLNLKKEENILIVPYASYAILELKNNAG